MMPDHFTSLDDFGRLVAAARDNSRISGLTHNFYRYPARFPPQFVRSVIEQFTEPGDTVFDPFMGGGTTLVEALALGRHAVGTDVSSLATFVSEAKTLVLSDSELQILTGWATALPEKINIHRTSVRSAGYSNAGYYRHLDSAATWRIRKAIEQALASAKRLRSERLEIFARCLVLRTAQWALDGRKELPSIERFKATLLIHAEDMIRGAREFRAAVSAHYPVKPIARCLNRSVIGLTKKELAARRAPKLILTSPPYPGVHVLYHRWQVDGRKETPAPFWIANKLDGAGSSFYTLGDRHVSETWTYFEGLHAALTSIEKFCDDNTVVVQVVAFAEPTTQLPRYLSAVQSSGFDEISLPRDLGSKDGRLWRSVPNRKWHAEQLGETASSKEVVLFHRRRS